MFQIRDDQFAVIRRKKAGDFIIASFEEQGFASKWTDANDAVVYDDGAGNFSRIDFDRAGFVGSVTSPLGRRWTLENGPKGKVVALTMPSGATLRYAHYDDEHLAGLSATGALQTQYYYDLQKQIVGTQYADGTRETFEYTPWRTKARCTDRIGRAVTFHYQAPETISAITDGNGNSTSFRYDGFTKPSEMVLANGQREAYTFSQKGALTGVRSGSQEVRYKVNDQGLPLEAEFSDGTKLEYAFDDAGRVTKAKIGDVTTELEYDDQGRLVKDTTGDSAVELQYDGAGRLTAVILPEEETLRYEWDADGRLLAFIDWNGGRYEYEYEGADAAELQRAPSGVATYITRNPGGSLTGMNLTRHGNSLFSVAQTFDAETRLASTNDSVFGDKHFSYDAAGQLLGWRSGNGSRREYFTYDGNANPTTVDGNQVKVDAGNQLVALGTDTFQYDDRGNLIERQTGAGLWKYLYDGQNLLKAIVDPAGNATVYAYDALKRRILKKTRTRETRFFWCGDTMLAETTTEAGKVTRQDYAWVPTLATPLATRVAGAVYTYHNNHLGTPLALTGPDGKIAWIADYSGFGKATATVEQVHNPFRMPGQYCDVESGLHYNRCRYYSPELGRYTTRDPLGISAGPNMYVYCGNAFPNRTDVFGLIDTSTWVTVGCAVAGVVAAAALIVVCAVAAPIAIIGCAVVAAAIAGGVNEYMGEKGAKSAACVAKAALFNGFMGGVGAAIGVFATGSVLAVGAIGAAWGAASYTASWAMGAPPLPAYNWKGCAIAAAVTAGTMGLGRGMALSLANSAAAPAAAAAAPAVADAAAPAAAEVGGAAAPAAGAAAAPAAAEAGGAAAPAAAEAGGAAAPAAGEAGGAAAPAAAPAAGEAGGAAAPAAAPAAGEAGAVPAAGEPAAAPAGPAAAPVDPAAAPATPPAAAPATPPANTPPQTWQDRMPGMVDDKGYGPFSAGSQGAQAGAGTTAGDGTPATPAAAPAPPANDQKGKDDKTSGGESSW